MVGFCDQDPEGQVLEGRIGMGLGNAAVEPTANIHLECWVIHHFGKKSLVERGRGAGLRMGVAGGRRIYAIGFFMDQPFAAGSKGESFAFDGHRPASR